MRVLIEDYLCDFLCKVIEAKTMSILEGVERREKEGERWKQLSGGGSFF